MTTQKKTTDALEIIHQEFFEGKPDMMEALAEAREAANLARELCRLREAAGLTQRELAKRVGTVASVICRLENADYDRHSLPLLRRVADALGCVVEVHLRPIRKTKPARSTRPHAPA